MAERQSKKPKVSESDAPFGGFADPDAQHAWLLARSLDGLAQQLEDPKRGPLAAAPRAHQKHIANIRELVRLHWSIATATRLDNEIDMRDEAIRSCKLAAQSTRHIEGAADQAIDLFGVVAAPKHKERMQRNRDKVEGLIRAYRSNKGGRGNRTTVSVTECKERLCDVMGWPASGDAIRQARKRRNKLVTG